MRGPGLCRLGHRHRRHRPLPLLPGFVLDARICQGLLRMALIGSLTTAKPLPKDADVLVTIEDGLDLGLLSRAACTGTMSRPNLPLSRVPSPRSHAMLNIAAGERISTKIALPLR